MRDDVLALLAGDHTYAEIARRVGISRERVRQLAARVDGIKSGRERQELATVARRAAAASWPRGKWFSNMVRRWLVGIDSGLCGTCRLVLPLDAMTKGQPHRCKKCTAASFSRYFKENPKARERVRGWQRNHPERMAEYARRYQAKLKAGGRVTGHEKG